MLRVRTIEAQGAELGGTSAKVKTLTRRSGATPMASSPVALSVCRGGGRDSHKMWTTTTMTTTTTLGTLPTPAGGGCLCPSLSRNSTSARASGTRGRGAIHGGEVQASNKAAARRGGMGLTYRPEGAAGTPHMPMTMPTPFPILSAHLAARRCSSRPPPAREASRPCHDHVLEAKHLETLDLGSDLQLLAL